MISPDYCRTMARYTRWQNDSLYGHCANLSDEQRKADRQLFFDSIHSTLNHILWGDMAWLCRFTGEAVELPAMGEDLFADFDGLRQARTQWDKKIAAWAQTVSQDWLDNDFTFTSRLDNKSRTFPGGLLAAHLFNHGTHHRGQVSAALSQLGVDYGSTDLPFLPPVA